MSLITNCTALPDHLVLACNTYKKGGISAVAIIDPTASIPDFTSTTDWNAAIALGTVKVIKNVKGIIAPGAPVEGENALACGSQTMLDGFDNTITWKDFNVTYENDLFYATLNISRAYIAVYYCQEQEIRVFTPTQLIQFSTPPATSPESNREKQMYETTAKWFDDAGAFNPVYNAPPNIFTV